MNIGNFSPFNTSRVELYSWGKIWENNLATDTLSFKA